MEMTGSVFRLFFNRGFGFLRDHEGNSRFFHARSVNPPDLFDRMHEGMKVIFEPVTTVSHNSHNSLRAVNVRIVGMPHE